MSTVSKLRAHLKNAYVHNPFLYKHLKAAIMEQSLIEKEIYRLEKKLGKEKVSDLVNQFRNEAFAQGGVNSEYVMSKLREELKKKNLPNL